MSETKRSIRGKSFPPRPRRKQESELEAILGQTILELMQLTLDDVEDEKKDGRHE